MRILLIIQGDYGQRMVDNIRAQAPMDWEVNSYTFPKTLPVVIDNPNEFLPEKLPPADLLISLGEHPGVAQLIPEIVGRSGAKAVITPADNRAWLPAGLARQIKNKLAATGVEMVYPVPFCSLTEKNNFNPYILEFVRYFGKPIVTVELAGDRIKEVTIIREAPCGNTRFVAKGLVRVWIGDAVEQAGLLHHQHPCLATMVVDPEFNDTLMHRAGLGIKQAVDEALKSKQAV